MLFSFTIFDIRPSTCFVDKLFSKTKYTLSRFDGKIGLISKKRIRNFFIRSYVYHFKIEFDIMQIWLIMKGQDLL